LEAHAFCLIQSGSSANGPETQGTTTAKSPASLPPNVAGNKSMPGNFDGPAELPRTVFTTSEAAAPSRGRIIRVPAGTDLQAAINAATCGEVLELAAGATFAGNFRLPAKPCDDAHWIQIRTTSREGIFPEGVRVAPCLAGVASLPGRPAFQAPGCASPQKLMATLIAEKSVGPITLLPGANHYRLGPGLEITRAVGTGIHYALIAKKQDDRADHIIVDRDWIHGTAEDETVRGFNMSGILYGAVIDSYLNDFHCTAVIGACVDSQAIAGGTGNLPQGIWKIENNFIEAAAESILFGGSGGTTVPTDITIRHNHMFKPLTWMPGQPGFAGAVNTDSTKCAKFNEPGRCPFIVKNLFELKNAQRVLLEGNVLENTWAGFTQPGIAIAFQALNETGSNNPNTTVADITVRYNRISHAASGITETIVCLSCTVTPKFAGRFSIHDDIFDDLNPFYGQGQGGINTAKPFQIAQCTKCAPIQSVSINHVTVLMAAPKIFMVLGDMPTAPIQDVKVTNSIVSSLPGTVITATGNGGSCAFAGNSTLMRLQNCLAGSQITHNVLIGASGAWPEGNFFPRNPSAVRFTNYNNGNGGDYHLSPNSPYKHAGTDGADLGANVDAVNQAIAGAL
jgi:hypothetical protein